MMNSNVLEEHRRKTRRFFMQFGLAGIIAMESHPLLASDNGGTANLDEAISGIESWLTRQEDFQDISRGDPLPHQLPEPSKKLAGMTRSTWQLEILSDDEHPSRLRTPMTKAGGTAINFNQLIEIGKKHAVRFPKVMSCLNIGCPLGMGIWEGVPLRKLIWMTQPVNNVRRVFYEGYHNEDAAQLFRSSLSINRVLEDPADLPPVIVCYKLNGHWLSSERGGPVRMVVPEAYGFKSIKWLNRIAISNISHANDTYAKQNNDLDSPVKTFCNLFPPSTRYKAKTPIALTGWAQVGLAGLEKVQIWIHEKDAALPANDRYFATAPWSDAKILGPPKQWGGDLPDGKIVLPTQGFGKEGKPTQWPLPLTKAHWAVLHPGLNPGQYTIRCRTIDKNGNAQPMPRPFRKSGHAAIQSVNIVVS